MTFRPVLRRLLPVLSALALHAGAARAEAPARVALSFDQGWRFQRVDDAQSQQAFSERSFEDRSWEPVTLPHSVRLEPENASGMRNFQGLCWYRRHFRAQDAWNGRKTFVVFDGAMQVADVWLNGRHVTTHLGGYAPFTVDVSDLLEYRGADNVLAVRLDNSDSPDVPPGKPQADLDFVYFGGLYRHVRLIVTDRLYVTDALQANKPAGGGIFVRYPSVSADAATIEVQVNVKNEDKSARGASVVVSLLDADQKPVAQGTASARIPAGTDATITSTLKVARPRLWHPYHPNLYMLRTQVRDGGRVVDQIDTRIGIRRIHFDTTGFTINGERLVASGANRHQDFPYVGYALPDSAQYRDIKKLREAGCLSLRTHYPLATATLDAADELGLLVIVSNPGWQWFRPGVFVERAYQGVREMVRRDRNRASVVLWEPILNETRYTEEFARTVHAIVHEEYPGDQAYAVADLHLPWGKNFDVVYDHKAVEGKPTWVREWGDEVDNWTDQNAPNRVARIWGEGALLRQAESQARGMARQLEIAGVSGFGVWAGIDTQRGYHHIPFLGGFMDLFRLPKFSYYLFASQRPPDVHVAGLDDGPMVFIASHWNQFSPPDVTVFSNCERVRLLQDGKVVGEQGPDDAPKLPHPPFTFRGLKLSMGRYEGSAQVENGDPATKRWMPGELRAEGLIAGQVVATHVVRTAGVQTELALELDEGGRGLVADGSDFIVVRANIRDARGTLVPLADDLVAFEVAGEGKVIGDASIGANPMRAEAGIASALIASTSKPGSIRVTARAFGLKPATLTLHSAPFTAPIVPLP
jgi:beta-galactosidase